MAKKTAPQVPPKSLLGNAIQYTVNQSPYLIKYCRHGMAEIDTNWVENKIRDIAIGKKNWLFMGNEDSGAIHALFYSLLLSATANDLNPRFYLHYLNAMFDFFNCVVKNIAFVHFPLRHSREGGNDAVVKSSSTCNTN